VMGFNSTTRKVFLIDRAITAKFDLKAGINCIYWADSGDPAKPEYQIKGYDFGADKPISTEIYIIMKKDPLKQLEKREIELQYSTELFTLWEVTGNDIVFENEQDSGCLGLFIEKSAKTTPFYYTSYITQSGTYSLLDKSVVDSNRGNVYLNPPIKHTFLSDTDLSVSNPYFIWQTGVVDEVHSFAFTKKSEIDKKPMEFHSSMIFDFVCVTGNYFVWIENDEAIKGNTIIKCLNMSNGKNYSLGSYKLNGYSEFAPNKPEISGFDGMLVWSAWDEKTGFDIYYTKLPEGK
jgi:hypothetical protein